MILTELHKFNGLTLDERDFKIRLESQRLRSPSSLWKEFTEPYDEDYWSVYISLKKTGFKPYPVDDEGVKKIGIKGKVYDINDIPFPTIVTPEQIKESWFIKRQLGIAKGNFIHPYVQNKIRGRVIKSDFGRFVNSMDSLTVIKFHKMIVKLKEQADRFIKDYSYLIPVVFEKLIGSKILGVGGLVDDIFTQDSHSAIIVDYKTDTKINLENEYQQCNGYLKGLDDCRYNKYRHQLSWYKKIIETETNLKADTMIVWFSEENDSYKILEPEYLKEIDEYNSNPRILN